MAIVEQELQTRMGGRSKQKVSGERKNYANGPKLVLINGNTRQRYNVRLFASFLVLPFKKILFKLFNLISQSLILMWTVIYLLC